MAQPTENRTTALADDDEGIFGGASEFFERNSKILNALLTVVLLAAAGFGIYRWQNNGKVAKSSFLYGQLIQNLQKAVPEPDAAKRKDALQAAILSAETLVKEHPGTYVGRQGQLVMGNTYYLLALSQAGGTEAVEFLNKAKAEYEKYIGMAVLPTEKAAGYLALGDILQNQAFINNDKEKQKEILATYEKGLEAAKGTVLEPEIKLSMATFMIGLEGGAMEKRAEDLLTSVKDQNPIDVAAGSKNLDKIMATETDTKATTEQLAEIKALKKVSFSEQADQLLRRTRAFQKEK
jgi:hypothetical protein